MKNLKTTKILFLSLAAIAVTSCNNDDDKPVNEEEVITTVITTLTSGGQSVLFTSRDLDGDGPNDPVITSSGNLLANTTYTGSVSFLNELASPAENITEEVQAEGADHQLFFQSPPSLGTFSYSDVDANGKPIGLNFSLATGSAATTSFTVTLKHLPNKSAAGVATGNIANAGGATDAEVTYPVQVN